MSKVVAGRVSMRDLKTHLSEWLGRVQAGEVVEVTSHRKPIARITAPLARFHRRQPAAEGDRCWRDQLERSKAQPASSREVARAREVA